ncbi:HAD family hydrolase [Streptomyces sp. TRM66268-LWL]|uniref:HAD family hydrolase n=1 Tax=Streptomyces polyasparticus TaxID=2767826 RepID=A0ABR7SE39_9ACTN|nr:HAD family hydrolase [Streptomyces polyasparticus]MBC9713767.1 HAD family hydrolase [Streptomyces polyasparticus]
MTRRFVVLVDLDDTLLPDRSAAWEAVRATLHACGVPCPPQTVQSVFDVARSRWRSGPYFKELRDLGISSWEALWADLTLASVPRAAAWGLRYRAEVWGQVLRAAGADADREDAARQFVLRREALVRPFPGAAAFMERTAREHEVWLVTNGASRLQRLKLGRSGLERYVARVFVSSEVGHAKPHPRFYQVVSEALDRDRTVCLMVGDSLEGDVRPAVARGWPVVHLCDGPDDGDRPWTRVGVIGDVVLPCAHGS